MNPKVFARLAIALRSAALLYLSCSIAVATALAQSPVIVKVDTRSTGRAIPDDFSGASYETVNLKRDASGASGYLFDSTNSQVVTLFKELGTKSLRIGGSTVDSPDFAPTKQDIDALFRFARAADVKVIYSIRLLDGDIAEDVADAKYIWENYRQYLDCFSIGNEPELYHGKDSEITDYSTFLAKWRRFASAITNAVPDAKFGGTDSGPGKFDKFAANEASSGTVKAIYYHYYVGGGSKNLTIPQIIDNVLSANWVNNKYPATYLRTGASLSRLGYPFRFTEANSYYTGGGTVGVPGGNNCYATALFALDFMHWWAAHSCGGVNFHTTLHPTNWWKYNGTIYLDENKNFQVRAMGYGIKAFDLGGHGKIEPVTITNTNQLNLAAYAVGDSTNIYVTVINKEHNADARAASVTIIPNGIASGSTVSAMFLTGPSLSATNGITLGGAPISNSAPWRGGWTPLNAVRNGECTVTVPAASAAIVKIGGLKR